MARSTHRVAAGLRNDAAQRLLGRGAIVSQGGVGAGRLGAQAVRLASARGDARTSSSVDDTRSLSRRWREALIEHEEHRPTDAAFPAPTPLVPPPLAAPIQAKLEVGAMDDPLERQADAAAEKMLDARNDADARSDRGAVAHTAQHLSSAAASAGVEAPPSAISAIHQLQQSGGSLLDPELRKLFERRTDEDFGAVRVHTGKAAAGVAKELGAKAFTVGRDVVFGEGHYRPGTTEGKRLIAHELTHVLQQTGAPGSRPSAVQRKPEGQEETISPGSKRVVKRPEGGNLRLRVVADYPTKLSTGENNSKGNIKSGTAVEIIAKKNALGWYTVKGIVDIGNGVLQERIGFVNVKFLFAAPAAAPSAAAPAANAEVALSVDEIRTRYRLLDAALDRFAAAHPGNKAAQAIIAEAKASSATHHAAVAAQSGAPSPEAQQLESKTIRLATEILYRVELILPILWKQRGALGTIAAPTESQHEVDNVIDTYLEAIAKCLDSDADKVFNHAESIAGGLPRSLINVDLNRLAGHEAKYTTLEPRRAEMMAWLKWVRDKLDDLAVKMEAVKKARQTAAGDLATLEAELAGQQEVVDLSIKGLVFMEQGLSASEYMLDQGTAIPYFYGPVARVLTRCVHMKEAALSGDLKALRERVTKHASDPEVAEVYKGLPLLAFGSRFAVNLAFTFVASYVSAGLGSLVVGSVDATAGTAATILANVGGVAVEAVSFTLMSRGFQALVPGQSSGQSFLAELAWNIGLFTVLKGVGTGVGAALKANGLPALISAGSAMASFPVLQGYGMLRYRVAKGQWPSSAEMGQMTADNIMMLAALTVGMRSMELVVGGRAKPTALRKFHQKYGIRFETLDAGRRSLEDRLMKLGRSQGPVGKVEVQDINDKARIIEDELSKVLIEVEADKDVQLEKIREELQKAGKAAPEGASEQLEREIGILASGGSVGLRGAGTSRQFSYEHGKTGALETALTGLKAKVTKVAQPATGLSTITAEVAPGEPPLVFQERLELAPPPEAPRPAAPSASAVKNTDEMYAVGTLPQAASARRKYLEDPLHWSPARRALHDRLIAEAKAEAQKFADALQKEGSTPTLYAMRGNTAAGKSRTAEGAIAELKSAIQATSDQRSVNPDNFKVRMMTEGGANLTSDQVHLESSILASRLETELRTLRTSDGTDIGSVMIDKRLATVEDVQGYARMAKETGRKLALYDVDAPLEVSLAGVLEREPGRSDPLPGYEIIGSGFTAVRSNRMAVIDLFVADPSLGSYELYATKPSGDKVIVASVVGGLKKVFDAALFLEVTARPEGAPRITGDTPITESLIQNLTKNLEPKRALAVMQILRKYLGRTWKEALDAHSVERAQPSKGAKKP